jgi:hypothetical protein
MGKFDDISFYGHENEELQKEYERMFCNMTQEEIDKGLMELIPKEDLTEEEFNEATRIWKSERNMLKVVKYLQSVEYGDSSKLAKGYFDLYIDDRHYDNN